jgi:hypothetical protein
MYAGPSSVRALSSTRLPIPTSTLSGHRALARNAFADSVSLSPCFQHYARAHALAASKTTDMEDVAAFSTTALQHRGRSFSLPVVGEGNRLPLPFFSSFDLSTATRGESTVQLSSLRPKLPLPPPTLSTSSTAASVGPFSTSSSPSPRVP